MIIVCDKLVGRCDRLCIEAVLGSSSYPMRGKYLMGRGNPTVFQSEGKLIPINEGVFIGRIWPPNDLSSTVSYIGTYLPLGVGLFLGDSVDGVGITFGSYSNSNTVEHQRNKDQNRAYAPKKTCIQVDLAQSLAEVAARRCASRSAASYSWTLGSLSAQLSAPLALYIMRTGI